TVTSISSANVPFTSSLCGGQTARAKRKGRGAREHRAKSPPAWRAFRERPGGRSEPLDHGLQGSTRYQAAHGELSRKTPCGRKQGSPEGVPENGRNDPGR